ncbi:MAG TPA: hypothetical protein VEA69_05010 [Tepidisphaeraceae bacterium]|nr:hypothetical protein [Tepidisphaeraceae bacterium]
MPARLFHALAPPALYFVLYCALTWPLVTSFNTHFFAGSEDGYQNIWNLWWTHHALTNLHQLPWHTTHLHWPAGTSLHAHTLAPLSGLIGSILQTLGLSLHQAYNTIVVASFVLTGHFTYLLARRVTDLAPPLPTPSSPPPFFASRNLACLFAGAAFTFSHFHFAHAHNHFQLVPLQWVPLAVLALIHLFTRPGVLAAVYAAGALLLVALTDYHLTFYTVLAGVILAGFTLPRPLIAAIRHRRNTSPPPLVSPSPPLRAFATALPLFALLACCTTGLLAYQLLSLNKHDPLTHNHDPRTWSTDLVDPLVPAWQWRFHDLTRPHWRPLVADPDDAGKEFVYIEHALYVTWTLFALFCVGVVKALHRIVRRQRVTDNRQWAIGNGQWLALATLFFLFSLGPTLHVAGKYDPDPAAPSNMPYALLERALPFLKMAGVPMRMMAMTLLALAIVAAVTLTHLTRHARPATRNSLFAALFALWLFESLPRPQATVPAAFPKWTLALRDQPPGAVIDMTYRQHLSLPMFHAAGHRHPMGEGYLSRYPASVDARRGEFRGLADHGQFDALAKPPWNFRYLYIELANPAQNPFDSTAELPYHAVFSDTEKQARVYDLTRPRQ